MFFYSYLPMQYNNKPGPYVFREFSGREVRYIYDLCSYIQRMYQKKNLVKRIRCQKRKINPKNIQFLLD